MAKMNKKELSVIEFKETLKGNCRCDKDELKKKVWDMLSGIGVRIFHDCAECGKKHYPKFDEIWEMCTFETDENEMESE